MLNIIIILLALTGIASANIVLSYEGDCLGKDIPRNYYSLVDQYMMQALIQKDRFYAVIRVNNTGKYSALIEEMDFEMSSEERSIEKSVFLSGPPFITRETTVLHVVKKDESYCIFVPIPNSVSSASGKIKAEILWLESDKNKENYYLEIPYSQRKKATISSPKYEGLETSLRLTQASKYILKLKAVGESPTYFMYHRLIETPMAIICADLGNKNQKMAWFANDVFIKGHVVNSVLLPGDTIYSTPHPVFSDYIWLEGDDSPEIHPKRKQSLVSCKDVIIIAQDYMNWCDVSEDESDTNTSTELLDIPIETFEQDAIPST